MTAEEELVDVPMSDKVNDPFFERRITCVIDGVLFTGWVEDIELGKLTQERLYRIRYEDGDLQHVTSEEMLTNLYDVMMTR